MHIYTGMSTYTYETLHTRVEMKAGRISVVTIVRNLTSAGSDLGSLGLNSLSSLLQLGNGLEAHVASTPATLDGVIELLVEVSLELSTLDVILGVVGSQSHHRTVLLVHEGAKTSLTLDNTEGHIHLAAQGRQPDHQLNGVDVMRDHHHGSLLLLDESSDMLQTVLQSGRGRARGGVFALSGSSSGGFQTLRLGFLGLGLVLDQQLEELGGLVLVQCVGELLDGGGDLQTLEQDLWCGERARERVRDVSMTNERL